MNNKVTKNKIFLETYGGPYGASLHDDFKISKEDKWFIVK